MRARKLISEADVRDAVRNGQSTIQIAKTTIVTPLAHDAAREFGVTFTVGNPAPAPETKGESCGCKHMEPGVVAIGSDHGGFQYKRELSQFITSLGWSVIDVGTDSEESCDYPDFAYAVALAVREGKAGLGIMIDGAGPGSAIACNKVPDVRAACVHDEFTAWNARAHNDANVITLGSRAVGLEVARRVVKTFLTTGFEGGRHAARVEKIADICRKYRAK